MITTAARVRELLDYDPETGVFTWRVRASPVIRVGMTAGCAASNGYRQIRVDGKTYYSHRLAFLYMTGEWPTEQVDHINGDKADNRWANLRPATQSQNQQNRPRSKNNKCGYKGVRWHRVGTKYGYWEAQIKLNGKDVCLGRFPDPAIAHAAYVAAAQQHFGEFARAG